MKPIQLAIYGSQN